MLDLLKERKEALEARGEKGFTLMEMLIVIAIIAILIAIAIPLFTQQLEAARDSTSVANIRSAYAEAQAAYLTGQGDGTHVTVNLTGGTGDVTVHDVVIESQQSSDDWGGQGGELPAPLNELRDDGTPGTRDLTFTYTDGELTGVSF